MSFHGFTDSLAASTRQPNECLHCHTAVRVSDGLCLRCLLQAGLTEDEDPGSESLDALLFEMEMMIPTASRELRDPRGDWAGRNGCNFRARPRHSRRIVTVKCVLGYHADSRQTLARFRR